MKTITFIDLFAGIGGIRKGFELACAEHKISAKCVFTSEIKPYAVDVLKQNHPDEDVNGDITQIQTSEIPDFDFLLAGFPCQAFSAAGKRRGFEDARGTLFFDVARILKEKQPQGFLLENVEGLVNHDKKDPKEPIGNTLTIILNTLKELGYQVSWKVLNASDFGVAQNRKRIYITGTKKEKPCLEDFPVFHTTLFSVLEKGLPVSDSAFVQRLFRYYTLEELAGKKLNDKRGGENNIHSWDIALKGEISCKERKLLNQIFLERRRRKYAEEIGIEWADGMPLSREQIASFCADENLDEMLSHLIDIGYLKQEYPKRMISGIRTQDTTLPVGYNIVTGKLSFEVSQILDPQQTTPTLVASDMSHLYVPDGTGIRPLTLREGLRLFGYPEDFRFDVSIKDGYNLLGNTVVVPVIRAVADRLLTAIGF